MAGLEVMASHAPKSASIFKVRDSVPWQIVCMALSKISKEASMYGRLKYSLEYSYHRKVRNVILKLSKKFIKPSIKLVSIYCKERKNSVNPQAFIQAK